MLFWKMKERHDDRCFQCTWTSSKCNRRGSSTNSHASGPVEHFEWSTNFYFSFSDRIEKCEIFWRFYSSSTSFLWNFASICMFVNCPMITPAPRCSEFAWNEQTEREKETRSGISVSFCEEVGRLAFGMIHVIYTIFMHKSWDFDSIFKAATHTHQAFM